MLKIINNIDLSLLETYHFHNFGTYYEYYDYSLKKATMQVWVHERKIVIRDKNIPQDFPNVLLKLIKDGLVEKYGN